MKPFLVTQYILKLLTADTDVNKIFKKNIYPLNAKQSTKFPFAVMKRGNITPHYSKDGHHQYDVDIDIVVVDDTYIGSVNAAEAVRKALELKSYKDTNTNETIISRITLDSADETMINDAFVQSIRFKLEMN